MPLYYECHVTVDPVLGDQLDKFKKLVGQFKFRVAKLLMQKPAGLVDSTLDSFCTGHSKDFEDMEIRMKSVVDLLGRSGFNVRRFKIEAVLVDSRVSQ